MKAEVSADTYDRWFQEIELVELDDEELTLRVPNNIYQLWIESNYLSLLRAAIVLVDRRRPRDPLRLLPSRDAPHARPAGADHARRSEAEKARLEDAKAPALRPAG